MQVGSNNTSGLNHGGFWARSHKGHEKHGVWHPLRRNCENEEVRLLATVVLGGCVRKGQHES
jgi:hypothetical protein